jgi:hypothetical protein
VPVAAPPRRSLRLGRYPAADGRPREVICRPGAGGSLLVIDRDAWTRGEPRLVAHIGADEPPENAALVCEQYLREGADSGCRALREADLREPPQLDAPALLDPWTVVEGRTGDRSLRLHPFRTGMSIPQLRWGLCRGGDPVPLSLRDAIAEIEAYEPLCALTRAALARYAEDEAISTVALAAELLRVQQSSIVLNRRLREVVLERMRRDGLSLSEIALRCGRVKRDTGGKLSGETSWLARRLGLLPEGGGGVTARWIHSDVLAVIARQGLGIAPREVELG